MLAIGLAFLGGLIIVTSKYINHTAAKEMGLLPGSVINYIMGSITALVLALIFVGKLDGLTRLSEIPWYFFLAGVFGLVAMIISNATLSRLPVLHSTTLIVTSQMITALVIDYLIFGQFSWVKSIGAAVVVVALVWDQKILKMARQMN
ncbi:MULTISPECIES: DMT family transporter [unclassified Fusibacter]|uniref:DMT family transporter n=1 Tax=unclassified Fusibacter TaxID=2624464 RepID=UPI0010116733|nr:MULTISPECIES: DMT family transporter [unclassified Fusibacter]MCK8061211.1 DMT family transporter [Fusibacter sp. A2]NPE23445.1 hypothetical protein [Fusibacter sp. A1]RXV59224.1 hypothetical protein DWB64_16640 [Fusibacter sp. A1]